MKIEFSGKFIKGTLQADKSRMVCIKKHKYQDVHLAFRPLDNPVGALLQFADLDMGDGTFRDKERQFEALGQIGDKIAECWNKEYGFVDPPAKDVTEIRLDLKVPPEKFLEIHARISEIKKLLQ